MSSFLLERQPVTDALLDSTLLSACIRSHPDWPDHVVVATRTGTIQVVQLNTSQTQATALAEYVLIYVSDTGFSQLVRKPLSTFQLVGQDGIVFCHESSNQLLFATLPANEGDRTNVFLFGKEQGDILCTDANKDYLVLGTEDGSVSLWNLNDGSKLDAQHNPGRVAITAVKLKVTMVVAGDDSGAVTVYDITTRKLQPVHRFQADSAAIAMLDVRVLPDDMYAAATAPAPRSFDAGGLLDAPLGLPWRLPPHNPEAGPSSMKGTMIAVVSSVGALHVYQAVQQGTAAWSCVHRSAASGAVRLAFNPDGNYLAVTSGVVDGQLLLLDCSNWQRVHEWRFPVALVDAGFLHPGSSLSTLPGGWSAGVQLQLYACPQQGHPVRLEVTLPFPSSSDPASSSHSIAASKSQQLDATSIFLQPRTPPDPLAVAWTPTAAPQEAFGAASAATPSLAFNDSGVHSAPVQTGTHDQAGGTSVAKAWLGLKPSTQPAPRSWLSGLPPQVDPSLLLPGPLSHAPASSAAPLVHLDIQQPQAPAWPLDQGEQNSSQPQRRTSDFQWSVADTAEDITELDHSGQDVIDDDLHSAIIRGRAADDHTSVQGVSRYRELTPDEEDEPQPSSLPWQPAHSPAPRSALRDISPSANTASASLVFTDNSYPDDALSGPGENARQLEDMWAAGRLEMSHPISPKTMAGRDAASTHSQAQAMSAGKDALETSFPASVHSIDDDDAEPVPRQLPPALIAASRRVQGAQPTPLPQPLQHSAYAAARGPAQGAHTHQHAHSSPASQHLAHSTGHMQHTSSQAQHLESSHGAGGQAAPQPALGALANSLDSLSLSQDPRYHPLEQTMYFGQVLSDMQQEEGQAAGQERGHEHDPSHIQPADWRALRAYQAAYHGSVLDPLQEPATQAFEDTDGRPNRVHAQFTPSQAERQPPDAHYSYPVVTTNTDAEGTVDEQELPASTTLQQKVQPLKRMPRLPSDASHKIEVTHAPQDVSQQQGTPGAPGGRKPAGSIPYKGYKMSTAKLIEAIRKGARQGADSRKPRAQQQSREAATPVTASRIHASSSFVVSPTAGDVSPNHSLLASPGVLMGSPQSSRAHTAAHARSHASAASTPYADTAPGRRRAIPYNPHSHPDSPQMPHTHPLHSPQPEHQLQQPALHSSALLLKKMDQLLAAGSDTAADDTGMHITAEERAEATRRAAQLVTNVPPHVQLYPDLPPINTQPGSGASKPVKQLHPGWLASRHARPSLLALWRPEDQQAEVCNTRGVSIAVPPTPADIGRSSLKLQFLH